MTEDLQPATTPDIEYIDPAIHPPPLTRKVLLLTENGVAVIGKWEPTGFIGWLPLPKIPRHMKRLIETKGFICQK